MSERRIHERMRSFLAAQISPDLADKSIFDVIEDSLSPEGEFCFGRLLEEAVGEVKAKGISMQFGDCDDDSGDYVMMLSSYDESLSHNRVVMRLMWMQRSDDSVVLRPYQLWGRGMGASGLPMHVSVELSDDNGQDGDFLRVQVPLLRLTTKPVADDEEDLEPEEPDYVLLRYKGCEDLVFTSHLLVASVSDWLRIVEVIRAVFLERTELEAGELSLRPRMTTAEAIADTEGFLEHYSNQSSLADMLEFALGYELDYDPKMTYYSTKSEAENNVVCLEMCNYDQEHRSWNRKLNLRCLQVNGGKYLAVFGAEVTVRRLRDKPMVFSYGGNLGLGGRYVACLSVNQQAKFAIAGREGLMDRTLLFSGDALLITLEAMNYCFGNQTEDE